MDFVSLKSFLSTPIEKIQQQLKNNFSTTGSKVFTDSETHAFNTAKMSFAYTLEKCCAKGFVNPATKDFVNNFERAGYDISKMDADIFSQLSAVYQDFQFGKSNGVENASSKLYCNIYELFSGAKFKEMAKIVTSSPFFKQNRISMESIYEDSDFLGRLDAAVNSYMKSGEHWDRSYEKFVDYALDIYHNDNNESQSFEGPIAAFHSLDTGLKATSDAIGGISNVLIIMIVITTTLLIVLGLIFIYYTRSLNEAIKILTEKETGKKVVGKIKADRIMSAIVDCDSNVAPVTKTMLYKPASLGVNYITESLKFDTNVVKKGLDLVYSATNGKEDYNNEESREGAILVTALVIASILVIIPVARLCCYWIHHLNVQIKLFFKENKEMLSMNIDELLERYNDTSTPPAEKKRLEAIIKRQEAWCQTLAKWSKTSYSSQLEASRNVEREIRQDDTHDFDHDAYEAEDRSKSTDTSATHPGLDDGNNTGPISDGSIDF